MNKPLIALVSPTKDCVSILVCVWGDGELVENPRYAAAGDLELERLVTSPPIRLQSIASGVGDFTVLEVVHCEFSHRLALLVEHEVLAIKSLNILL